MDNQTIKRYEMLRRVRDFGAAQAAALAEGSFGRELFTTHAQCLTLG